MKVLVFCPAYNEAGCIGSVIREIRDTRPEVDVLVLDDGSQDETARVSREAGAEVLTTFPNRGIFKASLDAFRHGISQGYDVLIQMDADGQHDPKLLETLINPIKNGEADLVTGSRFLGEWHEKSTLSKSVGLPLFSYLTSLGLGQHITDTTTGFRAFGRKTFDIVLGLDNYDFIDGVALIEMAHKGIRIREIPTTMRKRREGESRYSPWKMARYTSRFFLKFTGYFMHRCVNAPLFKGALATLCAGWAFVVFAHYLQRWYDGSASLHSLSQHLLTLIHHS